MSEILQELSPVEVPLALDANLIAYSSLFGSLPQAELHADGGLLWFETGIPNDVFNGVLQTLLEPEALPAAIERIIAHFQRRGLPFRWHLGPSSRPGNFGDLFAAHGISHVEDEPGMAVDLFALNEDLPTPSNLIVHPVDTRDMVEQWTRVWGSGAPEEVVGQWFTAYAGLPFGPDRSLRLYLGTIDGEPVATLALFFAAGVASINWVVTVPRFRRQGIGAAMTLLAAREARSAGYQVKESFVVERNAARDESTILILGTLRSEKQDFFSKVQVFSLLMVKGKDGRTILNIPAWPALVALTVFFVMRAIRTRQS